MTRWTLFVVLLLLAAIAHAQAPAQPSLIETDSRQVRTDLQSLLHRYPPQLAVVLRLDPTLLGNQSYMANYPALTTFVAQHPEVAHNTGFFLDGPSPYDTDRDTVAFRFWHEFIDVAAPLTIFLVVTGVLLWIVKTLIEQRRWTRLSAVQTEVHSKLMDRFTSNEELLAYLQSPAGKRLLDSAPMPMESGPRTMSAPVGRIFWSLQAGLALIGVGIGFDLVSLRATLPASTPLYGIGVVSLLVGISFLVSAVVFYTLSRRFGLWPATMSSSE